jgi:hypothetical protein
MFLSAALAGLVAGAVGRFWVGGAAGLAGVAFSSEQLVMAAVASRRRRDRFMIAASIGNP